MRIWLCAYVDAYLAMRVWLCVYVYAHVPTRRGRGPAVGATGKRLYLATRVLREARYPLCIWSYEDGLVLTGCVCYQDRDPWYCTIPLLADAFGGFRCRG
eukprot:2414361-Rhodomonas_salina.3